MDKNISFLVGQRLKLLRELLLFTVDEICKIIGIPPTTLRRIENGDTNSIEKWISKLSDLYQVNEETILDVKKPLPNWKTLRRNILSKHRNNNFIIESIDKTPYPKKAIQFRVLQSNFLNLFKSTQEVLDHLVKRYNWTYDYEKILMALDSLVDDGVLEIENKNLNPRKFRKSRKPNKALQSIPSAIVIKLEELVNKNKIDYVTPIYDRMANMLLVLREGDISRSKLYQRIDYKNLYKNHQKSLKILETLILVEKTEEKPTSSKQMYRLTERGRKLLRELNIEVTG